MSAARLTTEQRVAAHLPRTVSHPGTKSTTSNELVQIAAMAQRSLRVVHTADLDVAESAEIRRLLDGAFEDVGDDFDDHDWDHVLGGVHALIRVDGDLVGHGAVVQRRLLHGGRAWRTGYVEGVAVRADHRRRGHASAIMGCLERVIRSAYDLGALSATGSSAELYARRGWQPWRGPTSVLAPTGIRRTLEDDGGVLILRGSTPLDLTGSLACDWRDGDVW